MRYECIFSKHLSELASGLLDLSTCATPERFRLVRINRSWLNNSDNKDLKIEIYEFQSAPDDLHYCAVSYPWAGLKVKHQEDSRGTEHQRGRRGYIKVAGAEEADPIAISVLYDLSWAAWSVFGSEYIWMDRLCIMQKHKGDKRWQIKQMFNIYHKCKVCIVIPGGLQRLATLEEETSWVDRAWTLQEVTAPQVTKVSVLYNPNSPANSVLAPFRSDGTFWSDVHLVHYDSHGNRALMYMCEAMRRFATKPHPFFGFKSSQYSVMLQCLQGVSIKQHSWIWMSAMMRTSSRPCDRIFSIMGLFDVVLDPSDWCDTDTTGPAIALVQKSLAAAYNKNYPSFEWDKAVPPQTLSWLLSTYWIVPHRKYSIFPMFPETSVNGPAMWQVPDGSKVNVADALQHRLSYLNFQWFTNCSCRPDAMDEYGYLTLTSPLVLPLVDLTHQYLSVPIPTPDQYSMIAPFVVFCPLTRTCWGLQGRPPYDYTAQQDHHLSLADGLAIWIGGTANHGYWQDASGRFGYYHEDTYIIVKKHAPWRFHRITHLNVSRPSWHPFDMMMSFCNVTVTIGGPDPYVNKK